MRNTYERLVSLFSREGYKITGLHQAGIEAHNENGIIFSAMREDGYFEATLYLADNDAVVSYDIHTAEYETDLFIENRATLEKTVLWKNKLRAEVDRLDLKKYLNG